MFSEAFCDVLRSWVSYTILARVSAYTNFSVNEAMVSLSYCSLRFLCYRIILLPMASSLSASSYRRLPWEGSRKLLLCSLRLMAMRLGIWVRELVDLGFDGWWSSDVTLLFPTLSRLLLRLRSMMASMLLSDSLWCLSDSFNILRNRRYSSTTLLRVLDFSYSFFVSVSHCIVHDFSIFPNSSILSV
jgi:hypothetical protein